MKEYYVLTASPYLEAVFEFIQQRDLRCEVHLNRTRFWIDPHSLAFTEFALLWGHHCAPVLSDPAHTH